MNLERAAGRRHRGPGASHAGEPPVLRDLFEPPRRLAEPPPEASMIEFVARLSRSERLGGEIVHVAITNESGQLVGYKIVDPSFHNWLGLGMALRDQQISDFPLCNKSFDLSYCGFDL